jgi:hypothetical protein
LGNYTGGPFLDIFGDQRTGRWAFDVTGDVAADVPEPGTWLLAAAGLAALKMVSRRA